MHITYTIKLYLILMLLYSRVSNKLFIPNVCNINCFLKLNIYSCVDGLLSSLDCASVTFNIFNSRHMNEQHGPH